MSLEELESLLLVQEHDLALDRLRHRRVTLPERAALDANARELDALRRAATDARSRRDDVLAEERRLDDESRSIGERATEMEQRMYSGTVTSPRELQAMQADVDMLKRHRSDLEDRELEVIESREALDAEVAELEARIASLEADVERLEGEIAAAEAEIGAEIAAEQSVRDAHASKVQGPLLADYEQRRARNRGAGAARLVGVTCQACHLTIPSTEAEQIRRGAGATVAYCDNCGAILVP